MTEQASFTSLDYGRSTSIARTSSHIPSEHNPVALSLNLSRSKRMLTDCLSGYSYLLALANMNDRREVYNRHTSFLNINQLDALNFTMRLFHASVHGTATYKCDDTRDCIVQFWPPDDEHMCSKHVEA